MMIQKYRAHSSLFTVEEVNSNISSRSSIGKFMKDFAKSKIEMLSHNENSLLSNENRASWKVLTPIRIVDYSVDDERKVLSDYTAKSSNSQENGWKQGLKTDVKPNK